MTWNNPPTNARERCTQLFEQGVFTYLIAGDEIGDEGTYHLQMFVIFDHMVYYSTVRSWFPGVYCMETYANATPSQNITYCKKGQSWWELGEPPREGNPEETAQKTKWMEVVAHAKAGDINKIDESYQLRYYAAIRSMANTAGQCDEDLDVLSGIWIYGPPDVGKSYVVREAFGADICRKQHTKWWDGYRGQICTLIDEVSDVWAYDNRASLKTWCDMYAFPAEYKNGSFTIRPRFIIITSNWSIDQVYEGRKADAVDKAAFRKRFIEVPVKRRGQLTPPLLREICEFRALPLGWGQ